MSAAASSATPDIAVFLEIENPAVLEGIPGLVLEKLVQKASEYAALKSQHLVDEVALENAHRSANEKIKLAEEKLKISARDNLEFQKRSEEASKAKVEVDRKLLILESRNTELNEKVKNLTERCDSLSNEKIDLLHALDRKSQEIKDLRGEVDDARKNMLESKKALVEYSNEAQLAKSAQNSSKMRQQNLEQEVELLKNSNDWLENELKIKTEEFRKVRSERLAKITGLESQLETLKADHHALKSSSEATTERLTSISRKYDEALVKIKNLQNAQSSAEEEFRTEMASQQRLGELWEKSAKDAKERIKELEIVLSSERRRDGGDVAKWRSEAESYRLKAEKLKQQLQSLEGELATAYNESSPAPRTPGTPIPSTPSRNNVSSIGIFSPSAQIISEIQKNGGSLVQLHADFQETKVRLERERHKNETLQAEMDHILEEMETHAPIILAERESNRRLEIELAEMSVRLEKATMGYERVDAEFRQADMKLKDNEKERILISQQVTDLSRQLQTLLIQNQLLTESDDSPLSPVEHEALQRMLAGQEVSAFRSDTQQVISKRLILFKDIIELQKQNEQLVKITRELGQKMEEEEVHTKSRLENFESSAVEEAKKAIVQLQSELAQKTLLTEQVKHERDMFRDMLNRGSNGNGNGNGKDTSPTISNDAYIQQLVKQSDENNERLKVVQQQYDNHKSETNITLKKLNDQINELNSARADLQVQVSRAHSQVELTTERYKNLSETLEMTRKENVDLKQRSQSLQDNVLKQDMRTQRAAEELIEAQTRINSVQNEAANLKAEKSLWKSIEARLSKENSELLEERGRLNGLLTNFQVMETERELRDADSQKNLLAQIDTLNTQVETLENRIEQEQAEVRRISDKKDADSMNAQEKIDKLTLNLSSVKEELIDSNSNNTNLERKVQELQNLLRSADERLALYQTQEVSVGGEGELSTEAQLRKEIASLSSSLKLAQNELKLAQEYNKELTELAAASEEGLKEIADSTSEFKGFVDRQTTEKDEEIARLSNELEKTKAELETKTKQLASGNSEELDKISSLESEKTQLLSTVKSLQDNDARLSEMEKQLQSDIEQQRAIARSAQENYEQEVVKHGQATDMLRQLRTESVTLREEVIELKSRAQQAVDTLNSAESSWESQKYAYQHEIEELKSRSEETSSQNRLLLDQLESLSANRQHYIREGGESARDEDEKTVVEQGGENSEYFRGIIGYLKREKEVLEEKYDISVQEAKRLKQRLDRTLASLDEVKLDLQKEQEKKSGEKSQVKEDHQKLMNELADLNVLRESNSSLRSQSQYYSKKCEELEKKLNEAVARIEPIEEHLRQAVAESEAKDQHIELLQKDNQHWKDRTQKILQKQEQIDPEELKLAKDELQSVNAQVESIRSELAAKQAELVELTKQKDELSQELAETKEELSTTKVNLSALEERFERLKKESMDKLSRRRTEVAGLRQQLEAAKQAEGASGSEETEKINSEYEAAIKNKDERIVQLEEDVNRLSDEAIDLQSAVKLAQEKIASGENSETSASVGTEELANLQQELARVKDEKAESEKQKAELQVQVDALKQQSADVVSNEEYQKAKERCEKEKADHDKMKTELNDKIGQLTKEIEELKKVPVAAPADENEFSSRLASLNSEHEAAIAQLNAERDSWKAKMRVKFEETLKKQRDGDSKNYQTKIDHLQKQLDDSLAKAKEQAASAVSTTATDTNVEAKHKKEIEAAVERARDMAKRESSMRMTLLQKKADKAEAELKALRTGGVSGPTASKPGTSNAPSRSANNRAASGTAANSGSKLPVAQKNLPNRPAGTFKGAKAQQQAQQGGAAGAKRPPAEQQQGVNKKQKGGET